MVTTHGVQFSARLQRRDDVGLATVVIEVVHPNEVTAKAAQRRLDRGLRELIRAKFGHLPVRPFFSGGGHSVEVHCRLEQGAVVLDFVRGLL